MRKKYNNLIKLIAKFMTSPFFVAFFFGLIGFWISFNIFSPYKFDPMPFMALNLVMSALAGIQATVVAIQDHDKEKKEKAKELQRQATEQKQIEYIICMMQKISHLAEATSTILRLKIEERNSKLKK